MSTQEQFAYSGRDNLEAMLAAERYNRFLVELVCQHAPAHGLILDFGAGIGTFARALKERGLRVVCLEVDVGQAAHLRATGLKTVESLDELEPHCIDFAYSLNVFEHIDDDVAALRSLRTRLREGAGLLAYVPAFPLLYSNNDRVVGHHRRYTRRTLEAALAQAGFSLGASRYVDSLGFLAALAYRMAGGSGVLTPESVAAYDRFVFPPSRLLDRIFQRVGGKNVYAVANA